MKHHEELTGIIVDEAFQLHVDLGPGLLESVYLKLLELRLKRRGLKVDREKRVVFTYEGVEFDDGLRVDLLVEGVVIVELKSVEELAPVHYKQVLTYLKLMDLRVGLLINFGAPLFKQGVKRIVN
jgi:GxxExxY protein